MSPDQHDAVVKIMSLLAVMIAPALVAAALGSGAMLIFWRNHSPAVLWLLFAVTGAVAAIGVVAALPSIRRR